MNLENFHVGEFKRDVHYRCLHPIDEGKRIWRFTYIRDNFLCVPDLLPAGQVISFRDKTGKEWMRMVSDGIWIRAGYSWNGCTPKYYFLWRWWGTPDFECTVHGSGVHDALYQFSCTPDFPLHRSDCDDIFKKLILLNGGKPWIANLYHKAVRKFGRWDGDPSDKGECSVILHH